MVHKLTNYRYCKIWWFCGAISLLVFNKSCSNLASLLRLRCSLKLCWQIFAFWSQSKDAMTVEEFIRINATYLFSRVGRTTSGFINARFWRAPAASKLPLLLNTANITADLRHSTNAVNSSSVSLASSGIVVSQEFFGNLSLAKRQ